MSELLAGVRSLGIMGGGRGVLRNVIGGCTITKFATEAVGCVVVPVRPNGGVDILVFLRERRE